MRVPSIPIATLVSAMTFSLISSAQTVFTDSGGADSFIENAGNWSANLPTNGVAGTMGINAKHVSGTAIEGHKVVHSNGTVSRGSGFSASLLGAGTTWEMNGANARTSATRGIHANGATFTLD